MAKSSAGLRHGPIDALVARQWGDLSDREVARRTGSARQTFAAWREGRRVPRFCTVARLAALLGLSTSEVTEAIAETVRRSRQTRVLEDAQG